MASGSHLRRRRKPAESSHHFRLYQNPSPLSLSTPTLCSPSSRHEHSLSHPRPQLHSIPSPEGTPAQRPSSLVRSSPVRGRLLHQALRLLGAAERGLRACDGRRAEPNRFPQSGLGRAGLPVGRRGEGQARRHLGPAFRHRRSLSGEGFYLLFL